jgi:hypothetical protein
MALAMTVGLVLSCAVTFFFFCFFFFLFAFSPSAFAALTCVRELGLCACVLGSPGCACNNGVCPKGGECVNGVCTVNAGLPSFVIPVAVVAGILVLLVIVVIVVIAIRRKRENDDMGSFHTSANSGFGGTAPAFLASSPSFYDPSPSLGTGTADFARQNSHYGHQQPGAGGGFGGMPPPPPSDPSTSLRPSYAANIYGGAPPTRATQSASRRRRTSPIIRLPPTNIATFRRIYLQCKWIREESQFVRNVFH